ncbi:MAG: endopeptidase La [Clostridia bacterium]|nr:endopeptidase La [Clostridia bacterium]
MQKNKPGIYMLDAVSLDNVVVYPNITTTFELKDRIALAALKAAHAKNEMVFLVTEYESDDGTGNVSLYNVGVVSRIEKFIKLSESKFQVVAEGLFRARIVSLDSSDGLIATVEKIDVKAVNKTDDVTSLRFRALVAYKKYLQFVPHPSEELMSAISQTEDIGYLADALASTMIVRVQTKQRILEISDPIERLTAVCDELDNESTLFEMEVEITSKVKQKFAKTQREAFLREQLSVIKSELGMDDDDEEDDVIDDDSEYKSLIKNARLPDEVREKLRKEASKLSKMMFGSSEASVIRSYLDTCLELPWMELSEDRSDIEKAKQILEDDHDGLEKVKTRILEYLAVRNMTNDSYSQILCLVGPPGVGKTSIAKSIATAMNRKYVRIALGGVRDEAEIRGHRRTYVGSMPGRIITGIKQAGTRNPLILLDEIDKLTKDNHGDPSSALLEVLDSDQNKAFRDNFIELPFDLSKCMFIATANTTETIPPALLDRMEIIEMNGYTDEEKLSIAKNHLIPKQLKAHGLAKKMLKFTDEAILKMMNSYTHESGVRNLEREIGNVCRKFAKMYVDGTKKSMTVTPKNVKDLLGAEIFDEEKRYGCDEVGVVNGLAWTQLGGDLLHIETLSMQGTGKIELTGSLGDVMKESAHAAISYLRKHSGEYGIDENFYKERDIHIHVPEGAIPKDGPSAGISMTTAILSELSGKKVKQSVAMTGEITLTGRVLRIGGLKEKAFAAYKAGVDTVIIPKDNVRDIPELDKIVRDTITFIPVENYSEVPKVALVNE